MTETQTELEQFKAWPKISRDLTFSTDGLKDAFRDLVKIPTSKDYTWAADWGFKPGRCAYITGITATDPPSKGEDEMALQAQGNANGTSISGRVEAGEDAILTPAQHKRITTAIAALNSLTVEDLRKSQEARKLDLGLSDFTYAHGMIRELEYKLRMHDEALAVRKAKEKAAKQAAARERAQRALNDAEKRVKAIRDDASAKAAAEYEKAGK